jgi:hypothetical protein
MYHWLISLCCLFFACVMTVTVNAQQQVIIPWQDYTQTPISPVARPLDALARPNGFVRSDGLDQYLDLVNLGQENQHAIWHVYKDTDGELTKKQWALMRIAMPEDAIGKLAGVKIQFIADKPVDLQWRMHTGGDNFYRTKAHGRKTLKLKQGINSFQLLWEDLNVKNHPPITGVELNRSNPIGDLGIVRIELVFQDQKSADTYIKQCDQHLEKARQTMLQWIADRGVDLKPLAKQLDGDRLEKQAWDAVSLLAYDEVIKHWGQLSKLDQQVEKFESQRQQLIQQLRAGSDISSSLHAYDQQLNQWVDQCRNQIPVTQRQWFIAADGRFMRPTGQPFRMYGPHFFRSLYKETDPSRQWKKWDVKYLAGMGFNGLRLHIRWSNLEPTQGQFNLDYLQVLLDIMDEAERYGLAVSVDMHWPFPDWFIKGQPGMETQSKLISQVQHNIYHWPDAIVDAWQRLAIAFKDSPNILAFEVPTNESNFASGPKGMKDYPNMVVQWNQWLKAKYQSREALAKAWAGSGVTADKYALKQGENWDDNTIEPLGYQETESVDVNHNYMNNPRLWDHLRFAAHIQQTLTTRIMTAIRQSIPNAVGMSQRTIGDMYDVSRVPMSYYAINTLFGEHVNIGTHYGMGGGSALEAKSLNMASYDSERQMENASKLVKRHVEMGLGFCPFAFHARGGGGMLLSDDDWHMKSSTAYLPGMSNWIRNHWPQTDTRPVVAIISNTRLSAINAGKTGDLIALLEVRGYQVKLFEGLKIVQSPILLDDCKAVITCSSYMDADLLRVLSQTYQGRVLLFGRLDVDALCHVSDQGLAAVLASEKRFIKKAHLKPLSGDDLGQIDLTGSWAWKHVGEMPDSPEKLPVPQSSETSGWKKVIVPGKWGEVGLLGSSRYFMGDCWHVRTFDVPANWKGRTLTFQAGAMDDYDWTFINGQFVGKTTKAQHHYWLAPREYVIPDQAIKWGQTNTIAIRVRNDFEDGGIWKGPVQITSNPNFPISWQFPVKQTGKVQLSNHAPVLQNDDLIDDVDIQGKLTLPDGRQVAALLKQDQWYWWVGSQAWQENDPIQQVVLDRFLKYLNQH